MHPGLSLDYQRRSMPTTVDFRSRAFVRACRDEGIRTIWRIPSKPHYGGHIERLIGTQMGAVHLLPGTTFSNPRERGRLSVGEIRADDTARA